MIPSSQRTCYLQQVVSGQSLNHQAHDYLVTDWNDRFSGSNPDLSPLKVSELQQHLRLLQSVHDKVHTFWSLERIHRKGFLESLWCFWIPLALTLVDLHRQKDRTIIQGILGGQGTGKTTLTRILEIILAEMQVTTVSLSLDDLYKTYSERLVLRDRDPRLIWRGPPGTHDVSLGIQILDQTLDPRSTTLQFPVFNKYAFNGEGDRTGYREIESCDILLFEGWFVGVRPISDSQFDSAPDPIRTERDRTFARDMNTALHAYEALWDRLDSLWVLNPVDYRLSQQWRWEAESKAISNGQTGMSESEVHNFVTYFWQAIHPELFIHSLIQTKQGVRWVIEIDANHQFQRMYCPG